uniref:DNA-directed RNA polymerase III subunit RPC9 n=1 Tax=Petromyzon marinus TaxID=7757 RepID=A0AAJ7SLE9_PETMA|nr:DNA-directed RNA polymerase III subunit RPC9 [Petromyzon marinus]
MMKYLSGTPCKQQSEEVVTSFLTKMMSHQLAKAEKLQLLNHRPASAVEIQLMVEESEERLSEEQVDQLLRDVTSTLPPDPDAEGEEPPGEGEEPLGEGEEPDVEEEGPE